MPYIAGAGKILQVRLYYVDVLSESGEKFRYEADSKSQKQFNQVKWEEVRCIHKA